MVWNIAGKIADFFHPVPTPRPGIKIRNNPEWTTHNCLETIADAISTHELRSVAVSIQKEIGFGEQLLLEPISGAPIHKKGSFVFQAGSLANII